MKFSTFFAHIQEAPWYRKFLTPVVDEVASQTKLLDIGTGSGKLLQMIATAKSTTCYGIDTSESMLIEARKKLGNTNIILQKTEPNKPYPFEDSSFDYITICNVLFNLNDVINDNILKEAQRILKKGGKVIVLTPTGNGNLLKLTKNYFSIKNLGMYIWFYATKSRAKYWNNTKYLKNYSKKYNLKYNRKTTLNGFALIEILVK